MSVLDELEEFRAVVRSGLSEKKTKRLIERLDSVRARLESSTQQYSENISNGMPNSNKILDGVHEMRELEKQLEKDLNEIHAEADRYRDMISLLPPKEQIIIEAFYIEGADNVEAINLADSSSVSTKYRLIKKARLTLSKIDSK